MSTHINTAGHYWTRASFSREVEPVGEFHSDKQRKEDAEQGSRELLAAYHRYFRRHILDGHHGARGLITAVALVRNPPSPPRGSRQSEGA